MSKRFPSDTQDRFMVRLPEGMREMISAAAKSSKRTMNAEIVARLELSFADQEGHDMSAQPCPRPMSKTQLGALTLRLSAIESRLQIVEEAASKMNSREND
ncbi:MAG: Arc family DNA-binding protein [Verrucomicrobia bacterium]|jgi:hypothetical protein|nr:Arc family DNA-binding protein [Verrucomicrobiota bacterium]